ncbi:hypothetical protein HPP92_028182 [Vanilla planifolia]|uniref:DNA-directed RNA polymerase I subunit RPA12 n=1 Tax=Vanilla planifolia TaxID=51239 RepID=A0A835U462_VANPL|nr:hypothetical protein HPP92_028182 [Vanilla planifolia]
MLCAALVGDLVLGQGRLQLHASSNIFYNRKSIMEFCHRRDFLFCSMCGTLLSLKSPKFAECPLCGFKRFACEIEGKEIQYTITAEDIRRELKIEPFVILESAQVEEENVKRAVVNESCPQCNNPQLEYYTKQLRSADEGQTVFYECSKCGYKYSLNT